ncbi:MAG TPA: hypothetical protein VHK26_10620, partial [Methyloceanibacter sp.]|nr:hypothetical protein [Methyloceanibacter sp.]
GLLLAMPITVCLAVLGRHVEDLHMFEVLLGDEPALTPDQCFYQRALSGDAAEATHQTELHLKDQSFEAGLEEVVLGGLKLAERDARRGLLDAERAQRVSNTVKEMLENLADVAPRRWFARNHQKEKDDTVHGLASLTAAESGEDEGETAAIGRAELAPGWREDDAILCVGGRTPLDEAAAALLAEILTRRGLGAKAPATEATSAGHIATLAGTEAKLVCLCYLGLGTGPAHIRYLVKRLRRILPEGTAILVAYFPNGSGAGSVKEMLAAAEADSYAASLKEAADIAVAIAKGEIKNKEPGEAAAPVSAAKSEIKSKAAPAATPVEERVLAPAASETAGEVERTRAAPASTRRQPRKQSKAG